MQRKQSTFSNIKLSTGFTLIELISVIVVMAIVSLGVGNFISTGTRMYVDTAARDEILSKSRFAVERLNRDIRYALPNSLRVAAYRPGIDSDVGSHCLEYFPIEWSTFYIDVATGNEAPVDTITGPDMISASTFNSGYDAAGADLHYVVVYPTDDKQVYVDDVTTGTGRIVGVDSVADAGSDNLRTVTFDNSMVFDQESTVERFYIVSDPISYCLTRESGTYNLYLVSGYGINENQIADVNALVAAGGKKVLMAEGLSNDIRDIDNDDLTSSATGAFDEAPFRIDNTNLQLNSIVHTFLKFERNSEVVAFNNEIHLRNSP